MGQKRIDIDSEHHCIPRERQPEGYNTASPKNLVTLPFKTIHEPLHRLFKNRTPQEQLEFWRDINKGVLSWFVRDMIRTLIEMEREEFYDGRVIR